MDTTKSKPKVSALILQLHLLFSCIFPRFFQLFSLAFFVLRCFRLIYYAHVSGSAGGGGSEQPTPICGCVRVCV